ncbi:MAG: DUF3465 domain-containing protein [Oleibacter sp.]|nr:DUF3465 domain-containing protein [Thalassolituus sp.]
MQKKTSKKLFSFLVIAIAAAIGLYEQYGTNNHPDLTADNNQHSTAISTKQTDAIIEKAFNNQQSDLQVMGQGRVVKVLRDDNEGSRHQKFLLQLNNGITLLFAHNIDLAPRVSNLREGDIISFYGEYEWSQKGGVVHWTHHNPGGRHIDGWLERDGQRFD